MSINTTNTIDSVEIDLDLKTIASKQIDNEITNELLIDDPDIETARAAIEKKNVKNVKLVMIMITEHQTKIIQKVANRLAEKYTFSYYDIEDIRQEAFIIGMEGLKYFDDTRGVALTTFLYTHINNRLKTFKRDNYVRNNNTCKHNSSNELCPICQRREWHLNTKRNLLEPIDIENVIDNTDHNEPNMSTSFDFTENMELDEILVTLNKYLPMNMRADYLRMLDNSYISKPRRKLIESTILQILEDHGHEI